EFGVGGKPNTAHATDANPGDEPVAAELLSGERLRVSSELAGQNLHGGILQKGLASLFQGQQPFHLEAQFAIASAGLIEVRLAGAGVEFKRCISDRVDALIAFSRHKINPSAHQRLSYRAGYGARPSRASIRALLFQGI